MVSAESSCCCCGVTAGDRGAGARHSELRCRLLLRLLLKRKTWVAAVVVESATKRRRAKPTTTAAKARHAGKSKKTVRAVPENKECDPAGLTTESALLQTDRLTQSERKARSHGVCTVSTLLYHQEVSPLHSSDEHRHLVVISTDGLEGKIGRTEGGTFRFTKDLEPGVFD